MMKARDGWRRRIEAQLTLAESAIWLFSARILLALLPLPRLMRFLTRPARRAEVSGATRLHKRQEVRQAIFTMRQRLGDQTTCLHRAIAAQGMLRRRGVSTTLYFGAARLPAQGLTTHAWVQDGEEGVVGYRTAKKEHYCVVASYPESKKSVTFYQQLGGEHGQNADDSNRQSNPAEITTPEARLGHTQI